MIQDVRDMHKIGTALRGGFSEHAPAGAMDQSGQESEIPVGERRRYRQFATMYSETELEDIYKRCRRQKFALTTTHFRVLIGVKKKRIRKKLAGKALKNKLSVSELRRLAREETSPRSQPGGRKPDVLKLLEQGDEERFLNRLNLVMVRWHEFLELLLARTDENNSYVAEALKELRTSVKGVKSVCEKRQKKASRKK